ncbi:MAG: hypothetical protein V4641_05465 [Pseudomonadota bacterium]
MGNVIDFGAYRPKVTPDDVPPPRIPSMTVHYYDDTRTPLRVIGVPCEPEAMRDAATIMLNGVVAMLAEANRMDGDRSQQLRMLVMLYADGRVTLASYNATGPNGSETAESIDWMKNSLPNLEKLLNDVLTKEPE